MKENVTLIQISNHSYRHTDNACWQTLVVHDSSRFIQRFMSSIEKYDWRN